MRRKLPEKPSNELRIAMTSAQIRDRLAHIEELKVTHAQLKSRPKGTKVWTKLKAKEAKIKQWLVQQKKDLAKEGIAINDRGIMGI